LLYCTVTIENEAKHIAASKIRKWPHTETFSDSSICCTNLWDRGILKLLEDTRDGLCQRFKNITIVYIDCSCQKTLSEGLTLLHLFW